MTWLPHSHHGYSRTVRNWEQQGQHQPAAVPGVIDCYIEQELSLGRMLSEQTPPHTHINRMGLAPKGQNTTNLSHSQGASVNDGVDPSLCSLSYKTVDDVARRISTMGRGTLMAAYRIIPAHLDNRPLQAIQCTYVDSITAPLSWLFRTWTTTWMILSS